MKIKISRRDGLKGLLGSRRCRQVPFNRGLRSKLQFHGRAKKLIDPRPNVALAARAADILVTTDGLVDVTDWNASLNAL